MPRYLTPERLCLAVIVQLYLDTKYPHDTQLAVLSFVASRILPVPQLAKLRIDELLDAKGIGAKVFARKLSQLPSNVSNRSVYDNFLAQIWGYSGLDSLQVLFQQLGTFVNPQTISGSLQLSGTGLSRASPIGQYIRRCVLEFMRLQFNDALDIWKDFAAFRGPTYGEWARKNGYVGSEPVSLPSTQSFASTWSAEDADVLLSLSIGQLQKVGTRLPIQVKLKLQDWIANQWQSGALSRQHLLAFFEHWKAGQYNMALESLHRYFDYSLVTKEGSEELRDHYQYALLHLSMLHAEFDAWEESIEAMGECIATARENHDTACLNYALSWLLYFRQTRALDSETTFKGMPELKGSGGNDEDEISFLKAKAKESRNWLLLASTLMDEARIEVYQNGSTIKAHEHALQAAYLNVHHDQRDMMASTCLFRGASFDRIGFGGTARRLYELVDVIYGDTSSIDERARSGCRVAHGLSLSGEYSDALKILQALGSEANGIPKLKQRIGASAFLIRMEQCLYRKDLEGSEMCFSQLQPMRAIGDTEIKFEISMREIQLLIQQRKLEAALQTVNAQIQRSKLSPVADVAQRLHLLVLKAQIFILGGKPMSGLSIALRAASTAQRYKAIPVFLDAITVLAVILNELQDFDAAIELLRAALPMLMESRQPRTQACITIGQSYVGLAGLADSEERRMHLMTLGEQYLDRAREFAMKLGDAEVNSQCLVMKLQMARYRGDDVAAAQVESLLA